MKKRLVLILIITILINFIAPRFALAVGGDGEVDGDVDKQYGNDNKYINVEEMMQHDRDKGKETVEKVFTEGTADVEPTNSGVRTEKLKETTTSSSTTISKLCGALIGIAKAVNSLMTIVVDYVEPEKSEYKGKFTIENLVFNRYKIFDIDFFDYNEESNNTNDVIKKNIAIWYFTLRNIAVVGSLIVLIYIGIRMAISTVASDKAKYQKMLIAWVKSFILVFVMHYIAIVFLEIQDWILNVIGNFVQGQGFEEFLMENVTEQLERARGWDTVSVTIQYYVLVYFQITFFLAYFKRFLKVGFLFVIAPLVTLTYAIDFAGDGEAQAYKAWLKEITFSIFLQSIHAVVYAIFIFSAAEIAKAVPIMGALLLMTLSRTEKIVKSTLKMGGKGIGDEKLFEKVKKFRMR